MINMIMTKIKKFFTLHDKGIDLSTRMNYLDEQSKRLYSQLEAQNKRNEIHTDLMAVLLQLFNVVALKDEIPSDLQSKTAETIVNMFKIDELYYANIDNSHYYKSYYYTRKSNLRPKLDGELTETPLLYKAVLSGECYIMNSIEEYLEEDSEFFRRNNVLSTCRCPVIVNSILVGIVGFNKSYVCEWTLPEITMCKILASLYSMIIQKQKLIQSIGVANRYLHRRYDVIESILKVVDSYVWYKDTFGKYVYCSDEFKSWFFNIPSSINILGKSDKELLREFQFDSEEDYSRVDTCIHTDNHTKNQMDTSYYIEMGYLNDKLYVLEVTKIPQFDKTGEFEGMIGLARDRTRDRYVIDYILKTFIQNGKAIDLSITSKGIIAYEVKSITDFNLLQLKSLR